jgi:iron complex outermembrane recepter protein
MSHNIRPLILVCAAAMVANGAATLAQAQSADVPAQAAQAEPNSAATASTEQLSEIVVTAQRRAQSLQSVPISITAFSQQTMNALNIRNFTDLTSVVPGLVITTPDSSSGQTQNQVTIQGIAAGDNAPTTAIYINDTPIMIRSNLAVGFAGSPFPEIFDLDRVEVLRGPQGTLFGASAMGGAIRFISHPPNMDYSSGYTRADVGFTDGGDPSYDLGAAYGAPVVPGQAGFRVSAWYRSTGGFIDVEDPYSGAIIGHNANSARTAVLQGAFTWIPVKGLSITPSAFMQRHEGDESDLYWQSQSSLPNQEPGKYVDGANILSPVHDDFGVYSLKVQYDFGQMSFVSDTSYLDRSYHDIDDWSSIVTTFLGGPPGPLPGLPDFHPYSENNTPTTEWQQEFRLSGQAFDSRLNWQVGAYFLRSRQQVNQLVSSFNPAIESLFGESIEQLFGIPDLNVGGQPYTFYGKLITLDEEKALYANIDWSLTRHFSAQVGVRVDRSAITDQSETFGGPFGGCTYCVQSLADAVQTPVTPRLALTYKYSPDLMVYASAAKGFRPAGSNSIDALNNPLCAPSEAALGISHLPPAYSSDSLWDYELGTKGTLFDRHLTVDVSAFYIDWTGIQTDIPLTSCGLVVTDNRGKAISQGFDLQFSAIPLSGLTLTGDVGYTDAYFPQAAYGAPVDGVSPALNVAGEKLPGTMPWSGALGAEYAWSIARILPYTKSYLRADYRYLDGVHSVDGNDAAYIPLLGPDSSEGYSFLNLRMGVRRGGFDGSVYVDNLTHAHPRLSIWDAEGLLGASAFRPLTAGITAIYRF